jgi:hypothetical protein
MVEVSSNLYDADGDVTQTTQYVDSNPADNRVDGLWLRLGGSAALDHDLRRHLLHLQL